MFTETSQFPFFATSLSLSSHSLYLSVLVSGCMLFILHLLCWYCVPLNICAVLQLVNWSGDCIKWAFWVKPSGVTILENAWKFRRQCRWISTWKSLCATNSGRKLWRQNPTASKRLIRFCWAKAFCRLFNSTFVSLALFFSSLLFSSLLSSFLFSFSWFHLVFVCGQNPVTLNGKVCDIMCECWAFHLLRLDHKILI